MKKLFLLLFSIMVFVFPCHCHAHNRKAIVQNVENYIFEEVSLPKKSVDKIIRYLEETIIEMYSEYYTTSEIHCEIRNIELTNEKVVFDFSVHCEKVLKASSAHELPYIQGLVEQVKSCSCEKWRKEAQAQVNARVQEIEEEYIGKAQGENADYRVTMSYRDFENLSLSDDVVEKDKVELRFVEDDLLLTIDEIKPESKETLKHAGMQTAQNLLLSAAKEDLSPYFTNIQNMLLSVPENPNMAIARECVKEWAQMWLSCKTNRAVIKLAFLPFRDKMNKTVEKTSKQEEFEGKKSELRLNETEGFGKYIDYEFGFELLLPHKLIDEKHFFVLKLRKPDLSKCEVDHSNVHRYFPDGNIPEFGETYVNDEGLEDHYGVLLPDGFLSDGDARIPYNADWEKHFHYQNSIGFYAGGISANAPIYEIWVCDLEVPDEETFFQSEEDWRKATFLGKNDRFKFFLISGIPENIESTWLMELTRKCNVHLEELLNHFKAF